MFPHSRTDNLPRLRLSPLGFRVSQLAAIRTFSFRLSVACINLCKTCSLFCAFKPPILAMRRMILRPCRIVSCAWGRSATTAIRSWRWRAIAPQRTQRALYVATGWESVGQLLALLARDGGGGSLVSYVPLRSPHHSPYLEDDWLSIALTCNIAEETQMLALRCVSVVSTDEGTPCHRKGVDSPTSVSLLQSEKIGGHS